MFRNIIWDVDGTLFDTYPAIAGAFVAALCDVGAEAPLAWVEKLAKVSLTHCAMTLVERLGLDSETFEQALERRFDEIDAREERPFPGVKEVCEWVVKQEGKNVIVTHRGQKGTQELLEIHGLKDFFTGWITHDDGFARKPDPAAFEAALKRFELDPAETLTVGDRTIDIQAGQRAGVFSCLFGGKPEETQPDLAVRSFEELGEFLERS